VLQPAGLDRLRDANGTFAAALEAADVTAALDADDAFHGVFVTASGNREVARTLARLVPRLRRLERLRFGSLPGRRSVAQHDGIVRLAAAGDAAGAAAAVRENWLTLGEQIDRSFPSEGDTP